MKLDKVLSIVLIIAIAVIVYINWGKSNDEEKLNKELIKKVTVVIDSLKNEINMSNKKLAERLDSIKVINTNKTIIKNNYIGVSNEVENINDVDSVANYIRGWLSKLQSPNFN